MGKTRRCLLDLLLAALCVGLGLLLPWAFRWVHNGEQVLLLLQLPVLLCGMLCGPAYGLSCGLLIVLLPQLFPGAAGVALSTGELWELAIYGFLAGLLTYLLAAAPPVLNVLMSLVGAMLLGRVFCGLLDAVGGGVLCHLPAGDSPAAGGHPPGDLGPAPLCHCRQALRERGTL